MKVSSLFVVVAAAMSLSGTVFAQTSAADHAAHHPVGASTPASASPMADGEVRKIDQEQGKVTLKHGPIASLDMPGMTMVFKVMDPKRLAVLKPGDKVKFAASNVDGVLTVTAIESVK
jgi:Cu/Ag efflux protein CusF